LSLYHGRVWRAKERDKTNGHTKFAIIGSRGLMPHGPEKEAGKREQKRRPTAEILGRAAETSGVVGILRQKTEQRVRR